MLTYERLREVLRYEPVTGKFFWRIKTCRKVVPGAPAGSLSPNGYWTLGIDGKRYRLHVIAWFYMTGVWPNADIDHVNRDPSDNRFANLRQASRRMNMANKTIHKNNRSGFKGVYWCIQRHKWRSSVRFMGRNYHCGHFETPETAHRAYLAKAQQLFGEFATSGE